MVTPHERVKIIKDYTDDELMLYGFNPAVFPEGMAVVESNRRLKKATIDLKKSTDAYNKMALRINKSIKALTIFMTIIALLTFLMYYEEYKLNNPNPDLINIYPSPRAHWFLSEKIDKYCEGKYECDFYPHAKVQNKTYSSWASFQNFEKVPIPDVALEIECKDLEIVGVRKKANEEYDIFRPNVDIVEFKLEVLGRNRGQIPDWYIMFNLPKKGDQKNTTCEYEFYAPNLQAKSGEFTINWEGASEVEL